LGIDVCTLPALVVFLAHYHAKCAAPVLKVNKLSREGGKCWGIEGYLPFEHAALVKTYKSVYAYAKLVGDYFLQ
jgi:hypothetical protein